MDLVLPIRFEQSLLKSPLEDLFDIEFPEQDYFFTPRLMFPRNLHRQKGACKRLQHRPKFLTCDNIRKSDSIIANKDIYEVNVDVRQFQPDEITLKIVGDNCISMEAKHEEESENGHIYRHFVRKYKLPEGYDIGRIKSKLSADGKLSITAPKMKEPSCQREIPIEREMDVPENSAEAA